MVVVVVVGSLIFRTGWLCSCLQGKNIEYSQTRSSWLYWDLIVSIHLGSISTYPCFILYIVSKQDHTHPLNGPLSGTTRVRQYQKGKTNLDFTEARDSEWQWHQLGRMQVCTSLQTDNHASIPPLSFLPAGCPSCGPTNSVKALKANV